MFAKPQIMTEQAIIKACDNTETVSRLEWEEHEVFFGGWKSSNVICLHAQVDMAETEVCLVRWLLIGKCVWWEG